jgi:hypothetical protein
MSLDQGGDDIVEAASEKTDGGSNHLGIVGPAFSRDPAWIDKAFGVEPESKRGRPRVMSDLFDGFVKEHYGHVKTDRGRQNIQAAYHAIDVLDMHPDHNHPELGWLVDWDAANKYRKGAIKWGILTEIGRIANLLGDDAAHEAARYVCKEKPSVKQAIATLRNWRMKSISNRDDYDEWLASRSKDKCAGLTLYKRLAMVLSQYCAEHPEMTEGESLAILRMLHDDMANCEDDE